MATYPIRGRSYQLRGYDFGEQTFYGTTHNAVDLYGEAGDVVVAPEAGTIEQAVSGIVAGSPQDTGPNGNYIVLRDAGGKQHWFPHLTDVSASAGQAVGEGQALGTVGWTGLLLPKAPNGAHVHYVLYAGDGALLDPRPYLRGAGAAPLAPPSLPRDDVVAAPRQSGVAVGLLIAVAALAWWWFDE